MSTETLSGYVYLIHAIGTNRYKIGRTIGLKVRLQQLQKQSPYPLKIVAAFRSSNPAWDEAHWQDCYKEYRAYGEWFEFDEDYYESTVRFCFWSKYEEQRALELAITLAKSQGIDWKSLEDFHPSKGKYFEEASGYLKADPYNARVHLEV